MGAVVLLSQRRQPAHLGALALRMYPHSGWRQNVAWLYAVGFNDGRVKLGITGCPRERLGGYFRASGGAISWVHLFGSVKRKFDDRRRRHLTESLAISNAAQIGQRIGNTEYFTGLTKADAIQCVRRAIAEA